jgi:hypothetical protein
MQLCQCALYSINACLKCTYEISVLFYEITEVFHVLEWCFDINSIKDFYWSTNVSNSECFMWALRSSGNRVTRLWLSIESIEWGKSIIIAESGKPFLSRIHVVRINVVRTLFYILSSSWGEPNLYSVDYMYNMEQLVNMERLLLVRHAEV